MKKDTGIVIGLVLTAMFMGACHRQPQSKDVAEAEALTENGQQGFKTLEDRYSYAYGADLAKQFKAEGIQLNADLMADGIRSVFNDGEQKMSAEEISLTIKIYQEAHQRDKDAEWAVATKKNKKEGEAFLAENAKKEGVVTTKSGLQYKVLTKGSGDYKPTLEDDVTVHYRGRLINGTEFDSSYARNEPYFTNPKALIEGWTEALQLMTKGAKWELYVPAKLAYAEAGSPPYVGPNAVLIFEVELLEIKKNK